MTDAVRATLWRAMREHGITGPEMFALRYGRRLCDLTPAKALEIITAPAVRSVPLSETVHTTTARNESEAE